MAQATAPAATEPSDKELQNTTGQFVTVACKLPAGLILRVFKMDKRLEPVMGGGSREVEMARELSERITVHGWSHPQNKAPHCQIIGGYALTRNVPAALWDLWLEQNKDSDLVKNRVIFAARRTSVAEGQAEEQAEVRSGLERMNPDKLPKGLKRATSSDLNQ